MADLYGGRQQQTPVSLSAGMDYSTLINALNQNFAAVNNQVARNLIISDGDNRRIVLGRFPDGTYGLAISKVGEDVIEALEA